MRQTPVACSLLAAFALVLLAVPPAAAQNKCAGYKIKAAGKGARCLLKQEARAALDGTIDDDAVQACHAKLLAAFSKADLKPPCLTSGDGETIDGKVSAFVADVSGQLAPGAPDEKKCQSLKLRATGAKSKCLLVLQARSAAKGLPVDPLRVMKCVSKFDLAFAEAEAQHHCTTTDDAADIEDAVDAFVDDVVTELGGTGSPSGAFVAEDFAAP